MRLEIELRCSVFPPVVNYIDWTRVGKAHTCLYKVRQLTVHFRAKTKHEVKGIVRGALRQGCVEAQIWGRTPKDICSIEGPQEHSGLHHS